MSDEYRRWEARFASPDYVFGREPNDFLASCKPLLPKSGRALSIADGEGRNGVWLAEQGLEVTAVEFSPAALKKARALARERGVDVRFEHADVHIWNYPDGAFDVVAEIFTQFSAPAERAMKWAGTRQALKPGGLMIIQGYTPRQLHYGTGGPKQLDHLYTRAMLEEAFRDFHDVRIVEEERELREGSSHAGMSAIIGFTGRK
jgi:SAM-dependent methyltransferase